ncbi:hypothetical protein Tco_1123868 [Tanacetum coccineum]|uniref:Uncharacterized protein n=1 Tax=Tanacetum coccineum TaxID=301880 RepID=A0ABQ5J7D0_9ASTR
MSGAETLDRRGCKVRETAHLVKGIKKGKAKASDTELGECKKGDKDIVLAEAPILIVNRGSPASKRKICGGTWFEYLEDKSTRSLRVDSKSHSLVSQKSIHGLSERSLWKSWNRVNNTRDGDRGEWEKIMAALAIAISLISSVEKTSTIAVLLHRLFSSAAPVVETTLFASPNFDLWLRSRVTIRPSSSSEFPIAPVTALPGIRRRSAIIIRPREAILSSPCSTLSYRAAKTIRSIHPYLVLLRILLLFHLLGLDASDQAHSGSATNHSVITQDCVILPRRSPSHCSEQAVLSLVDKLEVDIELGIGDGDDVRDHVEIDPRDVRDGTEEYEADTSAGDTVEVGIDQMLAPIVEEEIVEPAIEAIFLIRTRPREGIGIVRIVRIETAQRRLEADQLIANGQRVSMIERIDSLRLENLKVLHIDLYRGDRVNMLSLPPSLLQEEFRQNSLADSVEEALAAQ